MVSRPGYGRKPWYLITTEPVPTAEQAWQIVFAYARRWQIEMSLRFTKSEMAFESPRLIKWESRLKFLLIASLAYAFLLSLLPNTDFLIAFDFQILPQNRKVEPRYLSSTLSLTSGSFSPLARRPPSFPPYINFGVSHSHKRKNKDLQAMLKGQRLDLEGRVFIVTFLQLVIGDPRAEVVDMMETNIACEPLQHLRKLIERTAIHASVEELPLCVAFPVGGVKVMLHVEEPDTRAAGDQHDGHFHQQEGRPANLQHDPADHGGDGNVRPDHAAAFALARALFQKAMRNCEDDQRTHSEQDHRAAHDAIAHLLVPRRGKILLHRHRVHVTDAAPVEVASRRVVDGMAVLPLVERGHHQHTDHQSQPVICLDVLKNEP